jgi:hypothetical protein
MTTLTTFPVVAAPANAQRGDAVLASQIEDCEGVIRGWTEMLGGLPRALLLWPAGDGTWREFRPLGIWWVRVR